MRMINTNQFYPLFIHIFILTSYKKIKSYSPDDFDSLFPISNKSIPLAQWAYFHPSNHTFETCATNNKKNHPYMILLSFFLINFIILNFQIFNYSV